MESLCPSNPKYLLSTPLQESVMILGEDDNNYQNKFRQNDKTVCKELLLLYQRGII